MDKEEIKIGILFLLSNPNDNWPDEQVAESAYTFIEIAEFFKLNDIGDYTLPDSPFWKELRNILEEMEDDGLIEERHFGNNLMGRVDYSLENPGMNLIRKQDEAKLKKKWRLS